MILGKGYWLNAVSTRTGSPPYAPLVTLLASRFTVDFKVSVPCCAQQLVDALAEGLYRGGGRRQLPQLLLGHREITVGAHGRTEDSEVGHVGHALAVVAVARLLGHLEPEHGPRAQASNQPRTGAGLARPGHLGTVRTVAHGLLGPRH